MDRRSFLGRAVLMFGALYGLGRLPSAPAPFVLPEGAFILDSGSLELGIVRDSVLKPNNDFQMFAQVYEHTGRIGYVTTAAE